MIITCEECGVKFNLNETMLKPEGSKVRCSKCKHVFKAYPPPAAEPTGISMAAEPDLSDDLTFSDLERMLETPAPEPVPAKSKATEFQLEETEMEADTKEEELDLSGLDDMLTSKKEETGDESSEDLELDLDLESDEADDLALEVDSETGDVDFSELDGILESDTGVEDKAKAETDEFDLSLELEPDKAQEESLPEMDELELDLDLDLDLEPKEEAVESAPSELELELDLTLEKADKGDEDELSLELDLEPAKEKEAQKELELELELDIDEDLSGLTMEDGADKTQETIEKDLLETKSLVDAEKEADELELELDIDESVEEKAAEIDASDEEIDLSELEQTLEMELLAPQDGADDEPENVELELADDQEDLAVEVDAAGDEEIDVSDIEEMLDMDSVEGEKTGSDDLELEFDIDSKSADEDKEADSKKGKVEAAFEETVEAETAPAGMDRGIATEEKKGGKPVLVIAIVLIILGLGIGGVILLSALGVIPANKIPFMSSIFKSGEKADLGKIDVVQTSINHYWTKDRNLFVITGQVKNNSTKTHRSIQVKADLYSKGKTLTKTVNVYCGNVLSNEDLQKLPQEEIDRRLVNQLTPENQPIKLPAGGELPFMIVIPNLTNDMEEYKVLVAGSITE